MFAFCSPSAPCRRRGLTLFELTTVLAVVFVLALLAFISSRSLVERTRVSRVREEHRLLARALQNYNVDYAEFPDRQAGLNVLLRPTAYLGELPHDPFQDDAGTYVYLRISGSEGGCVLISPGPDGDFDLPAELWALADTRQVDAARLPAGLRMAGSAGSLARLAPEPSSPSGGTAPVTEAQLAVLRTYIRLAQYDPDKGPDGDIVTFLH